jgi:hypothetical protein
MNIDRPFFVAGRRVHHIVTGPAAFVREMQNLYSLAVRSWGVNGSGVSISTWLFAKNKV